MSWEETYREAQQVWRLKADSLLQELAPSIPKGKVLDLGVGEGRNALIFAMQGYEVTGIDSAPTAIARCLERAQSMNLAFEGMVGDIREAPMQVDSLSLVISTMTLQFMKYSESKALLERVCAALKPGGFVYLTVFSTEDPGLERSKAKLTEIEKNSFFWEHLNTNVHYFAKDELLTPLAALKLHHFSQALILDLGHPGVPDEHYHGILSYIGQKI
jgi:tellurite methyltransferase